MLLEANELLLECGGISPIIPALVVRALERGCMELIKKPKGYENDLSDYGPVFFDSWCGEPFCWGFKILHHLGEERFNELCQFGSLECSHPEMNWFLIVKKLNRDEAVKKYGSITDEEFGPRGGWKSITFGNKKFSAKELRPY